MVATTELTRPPTLHPDAVEFRARINTDANVHVTRLRETLLSLLAERLSEHHQLTLDANVSVADKRAANAVLEQLGKRYGRSRIVSLQVKQTRDMAGGHIFTLDELFTIAHILGFRPTVMY